MAKIYIDVGAQRIQTWISKALSLKLVRGGSILLTESTQNDKIKDWLNRNGISEFVVTDEAGDIDGVVVLVEAEVSEELPKDELEQRADEVCGQLLLHLNEQLPGVEWAGWRCRATNFLEAFQQAVIQEKPDKRYYLQPSTSEFNALQLCKGCEAEPATFFIKPLNGYYGQDCYKRFKNSTKKYEGEWMVDNDGWPSDFIDLALTKGDFSGSVEKEIPQVKERLRNHVATICADGNRIGAFFEELGRHSKLADFKRKAIELLDKQTQRAVEEAAFKIQGDNGEAALIPHYHGGDDVLVSVTADEAWNFAAYLIQEFEKLRGEYKNWLEEIKGLKEDLRKELHGLIDQISLGVGIVFSHHAYPFYVCRLKGEEALSKAKQKTKGEKSAICWMDLTEDGGDSLHTQAIHFIEFQTVKEQLLDVQDSPPLAKRLPVVIRSLNKTAQNNLSNQWYAWISDDVIAQKRRDGGASWEEEQQKFKEYINAWAKRTGRVEDEICLETLEADLHRARWWPYIAPESNSEKEQSGSGEN